MAVSMQLRRGTAAAWTAANTVLLQGQEGYESDTGKRKVGDGTTAWNSLAYDTLDLSTLVPLTQKAAANGVATLDSGSKIPIGQLPTSVVEYKGVWNATTNSPSLADGSGNVGDVYRVTVAGTQNLGSGALTFDVGDQAVLNASSVWEKWDQTDAVASVAGRTGAVTLTKTDVGLGNADNTSDAAKPVSTAQQTALDLKAPLASPALTGSPTAPTQTAADNSTKVATTAYVDTADALDRARLTLLETNVPLAAALPARVVLPKRRTLLASGNSVLAAGHGWVLGGGSLDAGNSNLNYTSDTALSDRCIKLQTGGAGSTGAWASLTRITAQNLTGKIPRWWFKIDSASATTLFRIGLYYGSGASAFLNQINQYIIDFTTGNLEIGSYAKAGEWVSVTLGPAGCAAVTGTIDWTAIQDFRFRVEDRAAAATIVYFGGLEFIDQIAPVAA